MRRYYITKQTKQTRAGFAYQTKNTSTQLWNGNSWTTDKSKATSYNSSPQARMAASNVSDAKIVTL